MGSLVINMDASVLLLLLSKPLRRSERRRGPKDHIPPSEAPGMSSTGVSGTRSDYDSELSRRLDALHEQGLHRRLRSVDSAQTPHIQVEGRTLLNFSSNDYLGLANE